MGALFRHLLENKKYIFFGFVFGAVTALLLNYAGDIGASLIGDITKAGKTKTTITEANKPVTLAKKTVAKLMPPSVKLLSPNGGQIFQEGYETQIKWQMPVGYKANLYLLTLKDQVMQKEVIAGNLLTFNDPYDWKVPAKDGPYWIQVELVAADTGKTLKTDESDRYFTIKPKAQVTQEGLKPAETPKALVAETVPLTPTKTMDAETFKQVEANLEAMPEPVIPAGKLTATVTAGADVTEAYPGDQILMAKYTLAAKDENFVANDLTVISGADGPFRKPIATNAVKRVIVTDENDKPIKMMSLKDSYAAFSDLNILVPQNSETAIKVFAVVEDTNVQDIVGKSFRLGIRTLQAIGQTSGAKVTLNDGLEITGSDQIKPITVNGGKIEMNWLSDAAGDLKYGQNSLMKFQMRSAGVTPATITGFTFEVGMDSASESPEVKEYDLNCGEGLDVKAETPVFNLSQTLAPGDVLDCELFADVRKLDAGEVTASAQMTDVAGDYMKLDVLASAPTVELLHSCEPVAFADSYLEDKVRKALGKTSGDIMREDVETLLVLDASGKYDKGAADISGIECLKNLQELNLNNTAGGIVKITDIAALDMLTDLKKFDLRGNATEDISPLADMTSMERLLIDGNKVSDLSPVGEMDNLMKLTASGMAISNLSPVADMKQMTELDIPDNQVTDITALKNLTGLKHLNLEKNQITNLAPLATLTNLQTLDLGDNRITDISALQNISALTELNLYSNAIKDITLLANLMKLTSVTLYQNASLYNGPRNCETLKTLLNRKVKVEHSLTCN